ncbi:putative protein FAR1-RELATED SEQUENCE 10 [Bienertia sinuspersici]
MMGSAVKYMGGEARTFQLDVDELCWFLLEEFAVKCGCYNKGDHIYYLIPDAETFEMGLRRVYSDDEVRVMSDVMVKFRCISCYVVAAVNAQSMAVVLGPLSPFTPFETFADLQAEQYEAENYEAQIDENANGEGPIYGSTGQLLSEEDVDDESESQGLSSGEEWGSDSDTDDEEFRDSRRKIEAWNAAALSTARDLQQKALQGTVTRSEKGKSQEETEADTVKDEFVTDYDESRQQRLGVKCNPGCPFRLYCSWDSRRAAFVVKSVEDQHTCVRNMESNRQLKSTWLAKQFLELFKSRPHWPAKEIVETIRVAYRVLVKVGFAYKVKYYAHRLLHGSMKEHYSKLGRYLEALKESSPNSYFKLEVDNSTHPATFDKVFFCFDGVKQGWLKGCRKVLCVDGCFLKTFLGGMLLSAIGRDANEQMYPLAWAVVEGETNASWKWFLSHLKKAVGEEDGHGWTIISDENPGILNAVATELPSAEHRHCARHIFASWHRQFKGDEMKGLFWKAVKAYNEADFNDAIEEMEQVDPGAVIAFKAHNPSLFCRAFNGAYKTEMEKNPFEICPTVQAKLEKEKEEAAHCLTLPSNVNQFQVNHRMDSLAVDLQAKTCTCRKWDLTGIPCCHAVACIFWMHKNGEDFVSEWYKKDTYLKAYSGSISPCPGERHWPSFELPLDPPPIKIGLGRPRKNRRKHPMENPKKKGKLTKHGVELKCSICKSKSHNKRKCPDKDKGPTEEPAPKKRRGRPMEAEVEAAMVEAEVELQLEIEEEVGVEAEVEAAMVEVEVELQLETEEEVGVEEGEEVGVEEGVGELQ